MLNSTSNKILYGWNTKFLSLEKKIECNIHAMFQVEIKVKTILRCVDCVQLTNHFQEWHANKK